MRSTVTTDGKIRGENMKVVTRNGKTLPVDTSSLDDEEYKFLKVAENVTMIDDGCYLKKMWRVTTEKATHGSNELEFVAERIFLHKPSEMEMIYFMAEYGLGRLDYCSVEEIFQMDTD